MQLPNTEEHFYITAENQKTISVYAYHKEQFFYEETCWEGGHPNPNPSLPPVRPATAPSLWMERRQNMDLQWLHGLPAPRTA